MSNELLNMPTLAIDDQSDNLLLLRKGLRQMGYLHCDTESPLQALARFHAEDYDLVLLDYIPFTMDQVNNPKKENRA